MELKLAKEKIKDKQDKNVKTIDLDEMIKQSEKNRRGKVFYLCITNTEKELKKAKKYIENKGKKVIQRNIRYGLDDKESIVEMHIM